nr:MAG: replication initiator protein [Microvirus sp.]
MPCFHPLKAWRGRKPSPSGKTPIVWEKENSCGIEVDLPCGQCIGCRMQRCRDWAIRILHESRMHRESCFVTLTYNNDNMPDDGSLNKKHFQDFMKRLRYKIRPQKIKYFQCGEYGDDFERPHYHACIMGFDFPDKRKFGGTDENPLYKSALLADLWPFGFSTIGTVSYDSAAYVARYCLKKVNGEKAESHYFRLNPETGELNPVEPEYATMSLKPGIGAGYFDKWGKEIYKHDSVIVKGREVKPPAYYDKLYEEAHGGIKEIKDKRLLAVLEHEDNCTPERLRTRERIAQLDLQRKKRDGLYEV